MKIIICGAGRVGTTIAKRLAEQRNDVTVIDRSVELVRTISESLDVRAISGHASDPEVLDQANASDVDMIVAVTQSDEVNMVACQVAHSLFDVPTKIARIRNQNYLRPIWGDIFSHDNVPVDVIISPEIEVAHAIHHRIQVPGAFDIAPFSDDLVRVIGIVLTEDCPILDTPLRQLDALFPDLNITVMGIHRGDKTLVPSADDLMLVGDRVYFAVETAQLSRALAVFGLEEKPISRVVVIGGGNVGRYLAADIIDNSSAIRVAVIEPNEQRAHLVAEQVPSAIVINGSALDAEVLHEASIGEADIVVAVANDDEVNILGSLLAKRYGAKRAITLINNPTFAHLVGPLGIDVVIDPRDTTVSTILQEIRRGRIRGVYSLDAGRAEVLEAEALDTSPLVGRSVGKARLPDGIIFGAIVRDGTVLLPRANTVIQARDRIIVFALEQAVSKVEQLFAVRLEFF